MQAIHRRLETKITNVSYDITGDNSIKVTVTSNADISSYSDFTLSSPERVVVDFAGMKFDGVGDTLSVNKAGVTSVRMGDNDERARVVVDISNLKKYNIEKTSNNTVVINVETKAAAPTPKPTVNNGNSNNNSTITADSSKLIVLDAGHGGSDSGAVGYSNGNVVLEKNLTLEITYKVKEILENAGYTVSMTRTAILCRHWLNVLLKQMLKSRCFCKYTYQFR